MALTDQGKRFLIKCWGAHNPDIPGDKCGLNYFDRRVEEGDIVDDIPAPSRAWLIKAGYIEEVQEAAPEGGEQ